MAINFSFFDPWIWRMAARDSRNHRRRLLLFMSSIALGIAALVAISSLGKNLEAAIDEQAKSLLGADLLIRSRQPFAAETEALFDSLGGEQSREVGFSSMVYFPKSNGTRLARIRALAGDFPFYGDFETAPAAAAKSFRTGQNALVDDALMLQYGAAVGDSIKVGAVQFRIVGRLKKMPGESAANAFIGPRVYFPLSYLEQTQLVQRGSQITYAAYFKFVRAVDAKKLVETIKPHLDQQRLRRETVASRKADLGEAMQNLANFLNLVGFIALLLGSVGVASAVHVYIKQKLSVIAVLRCLGAATRQTFNIFLIQALALGVIGSVVGAVIGVYIQTLLPGVLSDFLPVKLEAAISWPAIGEGMLAGLAMALLFALLPLISIRNISPLLTLRSDYEAAAIHKDSWRWLLYALIAAAVSGFAMRQMRGWLQGIIFALAVGAAFGLLSAAAKLLTVFTRKFFPEGWSYTWRQGLANLFRPHNQTLMMMLAIGFGAFLISTLYLTQHTLLRQVSLTGADQQPNLVFFDIQPDQQAEVAALIRAEGLPVMQQVPIVTMRLEQINGKDVRELQKDSTAGISGWALRREYRSSYRDSLNDNETLIAGKFQKSADQQNDTIYVSLEKDIAEELKVKVGDELVFDVQGVPITTRVGSVREVNWQRMMPSFYVLFPRGVLEAAPQFHVIVTRAPSNAQSAALQQAMVRRFPNVSGIDLALILNTVDAILSKASFVIRFMALFSIMTGLLVLAGAVITSRYQRIQESVLLRTLGANRRQVFRIMAVEYFFLGGFAALTGLLLAAAASWALAVFVFKTSFAPALLPMLIILTVIMGLTMLIGMLNSRGIIDRPPLEVLRAEA
ncbi:ABC transporter permease [candidate division KSB1 bacterium]|nr:ABC transporter permease [candidate division KSB1 bacterium]